MCLASALTIKEDLMSDTAPTYPPLDLESPQLTLRAVITGMLIGGPFHFVMSTLALKSVGDSICPLQLPC